MIVTAGLRLMANLLVGAAVNPLNATYCYMAVGSDPTAVTAADTDMTAIIGSRKQVTTAPTVSASGTVTITFTTQFGSSEGNGHWQENGVFNASSSGTMFIHKVFASDPGTKSSGDVWALSKTVTLTTS